MAKILAALLIALTSFAHAGELIVDTVSIHSNKEHFEDHTTTWKTSDGLIIKKTTTTVGIAYNNVNPGVGYKFDDGWMIGGYKNSYFKPSYYVAKEWMFTKQFGAFVGVASGYKYATGHEFSVIAAFNYKIPLTERVSANILFMPKVVSNMDAVAHLAFSYKFD